jgi:hypothetical protein
MKLKVVEQSYDELSQAPLFQRMSEVQDQETLTKDLDNDLARTNFIMSNTTVEQAKSTIKTGWKDGFTQGDIMGENFGGNLLSPILLNKMETSDDNLLDLYEHTNKKSISFCYDTSEGFNGFSIFPMHNKDQPNQPYFIIQHTKNINDKFEDRQVTLIGQDVFFDDDVIKSLNNDSEIPADNFNSTVQQKLTQIIENDTVKKLVQPLFNKNGLNPDKLAKVKDRLYNFNLDRQEQKKELLEKLKEVKNDLPNIQELINKPVGYDSWIDANFQKKLDTYASELTGDQIKTVLTKINDIEDHDAKNHNRARNHVKRQWIQAGLNSGNLKHDDLSLTSISDQKTKTLIQNHKTISRALSQLEKALQNAGSTKTISLKSKIEYINTLLASDESNLGNNLKEANEKLIDGNSLRSHRNFIGDCLKFTFGNIGILLWEGLKGMASQFSLLTESPANLRQSQISFFSFKPCSSKVADEITNMGASIDSSDQITISS